VRSALLAINIVRIEVASDPFLEFSVSLMSGIADRIEEFGIAPGRHNLREGADRVRLAVELHVLDMKNGGLRNAFRAVSPPASARSRHSVSLAIETFVSRDNLADQRLLAMQMPCGLFYSAWQFSCFGIIIVRAYGAPEEIRTHDPQILV
jgi:hypothetical protein